MRKIIIVLILALELVPCGLIAQVDDSYTKALLHFDGVFTDESGKPWASYGNAVTTTTQSKFGGYSLYLDGAGDWLETTSSVADFSFPGDFTIDFWINCGNQSIFNNIFSLTDEAETMPFWLFCFDNSDNFPGISTTGFSSDFILSSVAVGSNIWHHVAVTREGATIRFFVDGNQTATNSNAMALDSTTASLFRIGKKDDAYPRYFVGYLDEIRISKGIARWVSNFTPPTEEYGSTAAASDTGFPMGLAPGGHLQMAPGGHLQMAPGGKLLFAGE